MFNNIVRESYCASVWESFLTEEVLFLLKFLSAEDYIKTISPIYYIIMKINTQCVLKINVSFFVVYKLSIANSEYHEILF